MFNSWRALTLAVLTGSALTGCHPANDHPDQGGGGGAPEVVPSNRLPESNDVNPSPHADTYIDEHAQQKDERRKGHTP